MPSQLSTLIFTRFDNTYRLHGLSSPFLSSFSFTRPYLSYLRLSYLPLTPSFLPSPLSSIPPLTPTLMLTPSHPGPLASSMTSPSPHSPLSTSSSTLTLTFLAYSLPPFSSAFTALTYSQPYASCHLPCLPAILPFLPIPAPTLIPASLACSLVYPPSPHSSPPSPPAPSPPSRRLR